MNRRSLYHYVTYLVIIVLLIFPLSYLSMPTELGPSGERKSQGVLASMRDEYKLSQANLGKIDAASETMKLATLGMRGVASNLLWEKANQAKMREDWTTLSATLEQIAHLQQNYVGVWMFQGWNVAYNISVEWDNYKDRYFWVIKGLRFLQEGTEYNENDPKLISEVGRVSSQKIGNADEKVEFRRLFRDDDDFHRVQAVRQRDNWLFGKDWYRIAERVVEDKQGSLGQMAELIFYSQAPMCQIYYCDAMEDDGTFGEQARGAWIQSADEWASFGGRALPGLRPDSIQRLADYYPLKTEMEKKQVEFAALTDGLYAKLKAEKMAALTEDQRRALGMSMSDMTRSDQALAEEATRLLAIDNLELADNVASKNRERARELANELAALEQQVSSIDKDRNAINYEYWSERCKSESSDEALAARQSLYAAEKDFNEGDLVGAKEKYERGFAEWRKVYDRNPYFLEDSTSFDMGLYMVSYFEVLRQLDAERPKDFPLDDIRRFHSNGHFPQLR